MPRFYFPLPDELDVEDDAGAEFPDLKAATLFAMENVRAIASEQVLQGCLHLTHRIDVEDEDRNVLATVRFGDAVAVDA